MHAFGVKNENWNFWLFLDTRQPIWNWEILEYYWVVLLDKIVHFLFKNGITANIQLTHHLINVTHDGM